MALGLAIFIPESYATTSKTVKNQNPEQWGSALSNNILMENHQPPLVLARPGLTPCQGLASLVNIPGQEILPLLPVQANIEDNNTHTVGGGANTNPNTCGQP